MPRLAEQVSGLANGLNVADGSEFKDYAAPYFLDEAAAAPLLGNARKIAERNRPVGARDCEFASRIFDVGVRGLKVLGRLFARLFQ